jgi:hypothetical protein
MFYLWIEKMRKPSLEEDLAYIRQKEAERLKNPHDPDACFFCTLRKEQQAKEDLK